MGDMLRALIFASWPIVKTVSFHIFDADLSQPCSLLSIVRQLLWVNTVYRSYMVFNKWHRFSELPILHETERLTDSRRTKRSTTSRVQQWQQKRQRQHQQQMWGARRRRRRWRRRREGVSAFDSTAVYRTFTLHLVDADTDRLGDLFCLRDDSIHVDGHAGVDLGGKDSMYCCPWVFKLSISFLYMSLMGASFIVSPSHCIVILTTPSWSRRRSKLWKIGATTSPRN